jgi:chemotaxis protein methyltransferase WspC
LSLAEIEALLRRRIGLDLESIGENALRAAVLTCAQRLGLADEASYLTRLHRDREEVDRLIEAVVVPETWFFRDADAFRDLARRAARAPTTRPFRVLSAPCSTGEEPYSIAMALADRGIPPARVEIEAWDVSRPLLAVARDGRYGRLSFRGDDIGFRDQWFSKQGDRWQIDPRLRAMVTFRHANLLDPQAWLAAGKLDAIYCRNLLIYLTREARADLVSTLQRHLTDDGVLYAGHAERLEMIDAGLRAAPEATTFSYLRAPRARRPTPIEVPARKKPPREERATSRVRTLTPPPVKPAAPPRPPPPPPAPAPATLDRAAELADQGRLAEAAQICELHLRGAGPDARAYELLGMVRLAAGEDVSAEQCFERALYLEPQRYLALVQLALLCEKRGDKAGAANLRRRAAAQHRRSTETDR